MSKRNRSFDLLLVGAGPRLAAAGVLVVMLWAGFFWATGVSLPFTSASQ
ncbi:MAG: hypothetical protein AAGA74_09190 [Pseudomonadota bacterium]